MSSRSAPAGPGPGAEAPGRCAHCGARLNPADQWCTLCHTPVFAVDDLDERHRFEGPGAGQDDLPGQQVRGPVLEPRLERYVPEQLPEQVPERHVPERHVPDQLGGGARRNPELTPERIEQLLERLAASEARTESPTGITLLDGLNGRGKGGALLLAGVGGLVLLAGGLLALYVLGTLL